MTSIEGEITLRYDKPVHIEPGFPESLVREQSETPAFSFIMFVKGQRVVCVKDDGYPPGASEFLDYFPVKDQEYIIRDIAPGINWSSKPGEVAVYLKGYYNPCSNCPPYEERGYNAERFAPLEEIEVEAQSTEEEPSPNTITRTPAREPVRLTSIF